MVLELLPVVSHQYDPLTHPCLRILRTISADCDAVMLCELEGRRLFLLPILTGSYIKREINASTPGPHQTWN